MALPSGESLLVSALINVGNVEEALSYGITPEHFRGYQDEYNWCLNFLKTYSDQPTKDVFRANWPNFPFSEHADVRSACDMVFRSYGKARLTTAMSEAVDLMGMGDVHAAWKLLHDAEPRSTAPKPVKLLTDL